MKSQTFTCIRIISINSLIFTTHFKGLDSLHVDITHTCVSHTHTRTRPEDSLPAKYLCLPSANQLHLHITGRPHPSSASDPGSAILRWPREPRKVFPLINTTEDKGEVCVMCLMLECFILYFSLDEKYDQPHKRTYFWTKDADNLKTNRVWRRYTVHLYSATAAK